MELVNNEKKQIKRLDFIRVLSCILVLFYHLNILKGGFLAVCTFFVLSGYLTCASALKKSNFSLKKYYKNRFIKIYIPLMLVVSISIIAIKCMNDVRWMNLKPETISVYFSYNNFWQLHANLDYFTRHVNSPFMHLWYISILVQFDLIFPIIFIGLKKVDEKISDNMSAIIVGIFAIASTILFFYMSQTKDIMIVYYNSFARVFSILYGVLLALVKYKLEIKLPKVLTKKNRIIFLIYTLILILMGIFVSAESKGFAIYMIIASIISARLIRYSYFERKHSRTSSFDNVISFVAKISYEIYLVQYPIFFIFQNLIDIIIIRNLIVIVLTFVISYLINKLVTNHSKVLKVLMAGIIIIGCILVLIEKDYSADMKELESVLNQNSQIAEQRNKSNERQSISPVVETTEEVQEENKIQEIQAIAPEEETTTNDAEIAEKVKQLPVVGVGDSVLLAADKGLHKTFPNGYFDGKVSRSMIDGEELLKNLKNQGKLGKIVILALANNSDYFEWRIDRIMNVLGDRQIYWVTAVKADDPKFNEKFRGYAIKHTNIHIVDWEARSKSHPEYFYGDGIHVKGDGIDAFANLIYESIYNDYKNGIL